MRLAVAVETHTMRVQALQVDNSRGQAVAAEAVERPDEDHVELAACGVNEQLRALWSLITTLGAALMLHVFGGDIVIHTAAPGAQLLQLVLGVLALLVRGDSCVDGDPLALHDRPYGV